MEFTGRYVDAKKDFQMNMWTVTFTMPDSAVPFIDKIKTGELDIKAVKHRKKRSLDSNAYAWALMQNIAEAINSDKWSVYLDMLQRYSRAFTHVIVKPKAVNAVREAYRTTIDLGDIDVNGQKGRQLQVYFGSSTFNSKEMSVFLEGIVSECHTLGIQTKSVEELDKMNSEWRRRGGSALIDDMSVCYVCKKPNPQIHHVFEGTANRKISDRYNYVIPLCMEHHTGDTGVHKDKALELHLKRLAQKHFEEHYGSREDFIKVFGRSWIQEG